MRSRVRYREDVYICKRDASVPYLDDNGYPTGESIVTYGEIVKYSLLVALVDSDAEITLYGAEAKDMRKISESIEVIDDTDIGYLDLVWIGKVPAAYVEGITPTVPPTPLDNNYIVSEKPRITPRQITIILKSVIDNA